MFKIENLLFTSPNGETILFDNFVKETHDDYMAERPYWAEMCPAKAHFFQLRTVGHRMPDHPFKACPVPVDMRSAALIQSDQEVYDRIIVFFPISSELHEIFVQIFRIHRTEPILPKKGGEDTGTLDEFPGKRSVIDLIYPAGRTPGLEDCQIDPGFFGLLKALFGALAVFSVLRLPLGVHDHTVYDLARKPRDWKTARDLRAYRDHFLTFRESQDLLIPVVPAVIFALLPQKAGAYQDFHLFSSFGDVWNSIPYPIQIR